MARRANGEGSVCRRGDGRWVAQLSYIDEDGNKRRRVVYGRTQSETRAKLKDAQQRLEVGEPIKDATITLALWLDDWVAKALEASDRKQATKDLYKMMVTAYIKPVLGDVTLERLRSSDVEALIVAKRKDGLSASTVRTMYTVLRGALEIAVRDGLVRRNVAASVKRPVAERTEATYLTADQAQSLLTAIAGDRLESLYRLMLATGLRRGEALALHWVDVDLEAGSLRVRWTLSRTSKGLEIGEPKTERSRRTVPLPKSAVDTLKAHRKRQAVEQIAAGPVWQPTGLVFSTEIGTALEPRNVLRRFDALCKKTGLAGVHLHTLRHSAASFLLAAGTHTKVVQEHLGHSSYAITADIYSHVAPAQAREAADRLDAALQW